MQVAHTLKHRLASFFYSPEIGATLDFVTDEAPSIPLNNRHSNTHISMASNGFRAANVYGL